MAAIEVVKSFVNFRPGVQSALRWTQGWAMGVFPSRLLSYSIQLNSDASTILLMPVAGASDWMRQLALGNVQAVLRLGMFYSATNLSGLLSACPDGHADPKSERSLRVRSLRAFQRLRRLFVQVVWLSPCPLEAPRRSSYSVWYCGRGRLLIKKGRAGGSRIGFLRRSAHCATRMLSEEY